MTHAQKTLALAIVKDVLIAAIFGATSFGVLTVKDIGHDITAIKVMMAHESTLSAATAQRVDRIEARVFRP